MTTHIKINNVPTKIQYVSDGVQTVFEFPFAIFNTQDVQVYLDSTIQNTSVYTVTKTGDTGFVTFLEAPESGTVITIRRQLDIQRITDFQEGGTLRADVLNDELDYQIACQQQIADTLNRSLVLPPYVQQANDELLLPLPEAGKSIVWNADGTALENSTVEVNALESTLKDYRDVAETEAAVASQKASLASSNATVAVNAAQQATAKATEVAAAVEGFSHAHSNCIAAIPQDINLSLSNGTLTLASGSIITASDGTQLQTTEDKTYTASGSDTFVGVIFASKSTGSIQGPRNIERVGSGSSVPADNTDYDVFFNTTDTKIYRYASGSWGEWSVALPLGICTITSGVITSIDKVFNGFGFIGHYAFVLPGLKVIRPNGLNTDGTLKSQNINVSSLLITELSTVTNGVLTLANATTLQKRGSYSVVSSYQTGGTVLQYCYPENVTYYTNNYTIRAEVPLATYTSNGSIVSKFDRYNVFHAVDYNNTAIKNSDNTFTGINRFESLTYGQTAAVTDNQQLFTTNRFVQTAFTNAIGTPRDVTVLWGDGTAVSSLTSFSLSEDFTNFEQIGYVHADDNGDTRTIFIQSTYWLNYLLQNAGQNTVLFGGDSIGSGCTINGYNNSSNPSTKTNLKVGYESNVSYYIFGINRRIASVPDPLA